jgi:hypothetical protein
LILIFVWGLWLWLLVLWLMLLVLWLMLLVLWLMFLFLWFLFLIPQLLIPFLWFLFLIPQLLIPRLLIPRSHHSHQLHRFPDAVAAVAAVDQAHSHCFCTCAQHRPSWFVSWVFSEWL